jgi:hypothetical protein
MNNPYNNTCARGNFGRDALSQIPAFDPCVILAPLTDSVALAAAPQMVGIM